MSDWKPGDIANGHVLGDDLVWRPVGDAPGATPASPPPSVPIPPPPPGGQHSGQPPKKSNTTRNVILAVAIGLFLLCGGCLAIVGLGSNEVSKEFEKGFDEAMSDSGVADKSDAKGSEDKPKATATWNTVAELEGNTNKAGPDFHLKGCDTRLVYNLQGGDQVLAAFYVVESGHDVHEEGGFPVASPDKAGEGETQLRKSEGDYYLEVVAANVNWTAKVQEKC